MQWRMVIASACVWLSTAPAFAQFVRISVATDGAQADGVSVLPSMSATGRFVAFSSDATNLVAGDTNGERDIFLRDRDTDGDGVFDEPSAVSTVRVSVGVSGVESNGFSNSSKVSADGRYVVFLSGATNLVGGVTAATGRIYRRDMSTGETVLVSANAAWQPADGGCSEFASSADARYVVFQCVGRELVTGEADFGPAIYLRDLQTGSLTRLSERQPPYVPSFEMTTFSVESPTISDDGDTIAFAEVRRSRVGTASFGVTGAIMLVDRLAGVTRRTAEEGQVVSLGGAGRNLFAFTGYVYFVAPQNSSMFEQSAVDGRLRATSITGSRVSDTSADGRYALVVSEGTSPASPTPLQLYDTRTRQAIPMPFAPTWGSFDATAGQVAFSTTSPAAPTGVADTNGVFDVFVGNVAALFDDDDDGLDDREERLYGLSTSSGAGDDGPSGDPDGDGRSNVQELAAGTHPRGLFKRYLAEGAASAFFRTSIALANPDIDPQHPASAVLTFLREGAAPVSTALRVAAASRETFNVATLPELEIAALSTVVESDRVLAVDRTMTWDTRGPFESPGYGAHTESAAEAPGTQWYLAEGATGVFELYYLLQNPQDSVVDVTVRYLTPDASPLVRTYPLQPHSRTTIRVNAVDPLLEISDVSAAFSSTAPILVERAMYRSGPGQPFALGHAARAVSAAATHWFLAEGATGENFDTYVLIANPSSTPATIEARFDTPDGAPVMRPYTVAPNSRFTILVDTIAGLEATSVSTTITSTNDVPVIVERAMYWPGVFASYYEAHASAGSTTTGLRWVLAEGEEGGGVKDAQTYVLIANTAATTGRVRITPLLENGLSSAYEMDLPANSRTTIRPGNGSSGRFGTLVESIGATPAPIVVEGAFYWNVDGVVWAAGSGVVATRLP
jgi:hypothetical protein